MQQLSKLDKQIVVDIIARAKILIKGETLFWVSMFLALGTSVFVKPDLSSIDWGVIAQLFCLMIVVQAFKEFHVLEFFANTTLQKFDNQRAIGIVLILLTAFCAAFVTNDVALITMVPLTLIIAEKSGFDPMLMVILQSQAANIGSAITPMGNPQNLFLFSRYSIPATEFFSIIFPFTIVGMVITVALNMKYGKKKMNFSIQKVMIKNPVKASFFSFGFIIAMLSVFRIIDFRFSLIVILTLAIILQGRVLLKVDYFLLATFIFFFIFIDNVSRVDFITSFMKSISGTQSGTLLSSALFSQFISNVPSAILFSSFTENYRGLLLGVNIGGSGTIIASLANLIAYKIYAKEKGNGRIYLSKFTLISFATFGITLLVFWITLLIL